MSTGNLHGSDRSKWRGSPTSGRVAGAARMPHRYPRKEGRARMTPRALTGGVDFAQGSGTKQGVAYGPDAFVCVRRPSHTAVHHLIAFTPSLCEGRAHDLTLLTRPRLKRGGSSAATCVVRAPRHLTSR